MAIAGYLRSGTVFDDAIVEDGTAYAKQNKHDYSDFKGQIEGGLAAADTDN